MSELPRYPYPECPAVTGACSFWDVSCPDLDYDLPTPDVHRRTTASRRHPANDGEIRPMMGHSLAEHPIDLPGNSAPLRHNARVMRGHAYGMGRVTTTVELPAEAVTVVAAPPEMLSQRNVEAVTGIPARVYLEEIRGSRFPLPVVKLGKLRLVDREGFLAYLRSQASRPTPRGEHRPSGAAAVLAEAGIELGSAGVEAGSPPLPRPGSRGKIQRKK